MIEPKIKKECNRDDGHWHCEQCGVCVFKRKLYEINRNFIPTKLCYKCRDNKNNIE